LHLASYTCNDESKMAELVALIHGDVEEEEQQEDSACVQEGCGSCIVRKPSAATDTSGILPLYLVSRSSSSVRSSSTAAMSKKGGGKWPHSMAGSFKSLGSSFKRFTSLGKDHDDLPHGTSLGSQPVIVVHNHVS